MRMVLDMKKALTQLSGGLFVLRLDKSPPSLLIYNQEALSLVREL